MNKNLIIIGAGPASLSLALSLKNADIKIIIIEKLDQESIANPKMDGRDIALTHFSKSILSELDIWGNIDSDQISPIKEAKVLNGDSPYTLHFNYHESKHPVDALGYLVPNYLIRQALYEKVQHQKNVNLITSTSISEIQTDHATASVTLDTGEILSADLVVAADSRFSTTRRSMGISASMQDFGRTIIVCRMQHSLSHHHTAYECFQYGRTIAVLPLTGNQSSIVVTVPANQANQILSMNEDTFNHYIQQGLNNRFGHMTLITDRYSYPLVAVYADKFVSTRFALLGDAAVGMHPVTAHGFNLGLQGQQTLSTLVQTALNQNQDIGSQKLLEKYQSKHRRVSKPIYLGTNAIVKLYTNDLLPAKLLRKGLLHFSNRFPPIKQSITRQLTVH